MSFQVREKLDVIKKTIHHPPLVHLHTVLQTVYLSVCLYEVCLFRAFADMKINMIIKNVHLIT